MFTGIVQELGKIQSIQTVSSGLALTVQCSMAPFQLGESIAVDGVCLTVTEARNDNFSCELSPETLRLTLARHYRVGSAVNLERALKLGDALGGHWVSGHVDTVISLSKKEVLKDFWNLSFLEVPEVVLNHLVYKGSISLNGVSLTINAVHPTGFEVMIIPHTLERTNLKLLNEGDQVNVEIDWMSKLIVQTTDRILKGKYEKPLAKN